MRELKRAAAARRFVADSMVARLMPPLHGPRPWIRGTLIVLGLALLIVAAARPRFGVYYEKVVQRGVDCFVLLDVSRSMLAEDVAPNRLERAKSDILDVLKKLAGDRVGLIVFAGKPVLKVPLTTDDGFFREVLDDVDTHSAPRGGTLIGDAIRKALDALPERGDRDQVLVLLTDGEDQESYPIEAAKKAAERGVKIFTVGLGDSSEGARIPVRDDSGKIQYVKEEGKEHWSKADQDVLKQIAGRPAASTFPPARATTTSGQIYADRLAGLARGVDGQEAKRKLYHERYQIFLALGMVLLMAEMLIPPYPASRRAALARRTRSRTCRATVTAPRLLGTPLLALRWRLPRRRRAPRRPRRPSAARPERSARGSRRFAAAISRPPAKRFPKPTSSLPKEPRIAFDRGCAYAAEGENEKAAEQFLAAATAPDRRLAAVAHYNLGCLAIAKAKARFGQHPEEATAEVRKEGVETLLQAAGHLRDCLAIDPQHADARYNLETIRLWIKHIEEVWRQRDREKARKEMNLLAVPANAGRKAARAARRQPRDDGRARFAPAARSPARGRDLAAIAGRRDRALEGEAARGVDRLRRAAAGRRRAPPPPPNPDVQKALPLLDGLLDDIRGEMTAAADSLEARKPADAVQAADRRRREDRQRLHGRRPVRQPRAEGRRGRGRVDRAERSRGQWLRPRRTRRARRKRRRTGEGRKEGEEGRRQGGVRLAGGGLEPAIH